MYSFCYSKVISFLNLLFQVFYILPYTLILKMLLLNQCIGNAIVFTYTRCVHLYQRILFWKRVQRSSRSTCLPSSWSYRPETASWPRRAQQHIRPPKLPSLLLTHQPLQQAHARTAPHPSTCVLWLSLGLCLWVSSLEGQQSRLKKAASGHHSKDSLKRASTTSCSSNGKHMTAAYVKCFSAARACKVPKAIMSKGNSQQQQLRGGWEKKKRWKSCYSPVNTYSPANFCRATSPQGDSRLWEFNVPIEKASSAF